MELIKKYLNEPVSKLLKWLNEKIKNNAFLFVLVCLVSVYYLFKDNVKAYYKAMVDMPKNLKEVQNTQINTQNYLIILQRDVDTIQKEQKKQSDGINKLCENDSILNSKLRMLYNVMSIKNDSKELRAILDEYINKKISNKDIFYPKSKMVLFIDSGQTVEDIDSCQVLYKLDNSTIIPILNDSIYMDSIEYVRNIII